MTKLGNWILVGLAAVLLASCGGGSATETRDEMAEKRPDPPRKLRHLALTLAGYEGPESAGLLMAEERGYFADVGLDVEILFPANPSAPVGYVVNEVDDLGVAPQPQVVLAREEGEPIAAVGGLISQPTAAMIWLGESKIRGIADLEGKTIAIPGLPFQLAFLESVLARAGLTLDDVTIKEVEYKLVPSLVSGRADAIFGGSANAEGIELESRGLDPVITQVDDLGVPAYEELVLIARADRVAEDPRMIRGFMSALRRGTAAAIEDPEAVLEAIEFGNEANPETNREEVEAAVEATLPLLSRSGYMNPRRASRLVDWMHGEGLIQRKMPVSTLLTNDYVP